MLRRTGTVTLVDISGGEVINDACAELQGIADHDQQSALGVFNGRFLMAEPGGSARNLLTGFFGEHAIGRIIRSTVASHKSEGIAKERGE